MSDLISRNGVLEMLDEEIIHKNRTVTARGAAREVDFRKRPTGAYRSTPEEQVASVLLVLSPSGAESDRG